MAKKEWANRNLFPSDDYWVAAFEADGQMRYAGVSKGKRVNVAEDTTQFDFHLRVNEAEFDADTLIPESQAAEILKAVSEEFMNRECWKVG